LRKKLREALNGSGEAKKAGRAIQATQRGHRPR
jgi:hypothetical protein